MIRYKAHDLHSTTSSPGLRFVSYAKVIAVHVLYLRHTCSRGVHRVGVRGKMYCAPDSRSKRVPS